MIDVESVTKVYRKGNTEIKAVDGLSWQVPKGTLSVIYGKSGSGKSTLLMMLGGMMTPTRGRIVVQGRDLYSLSRAGRNRFRRESVGFIFQRFHLLPYFTVYENLAISLAINNVGNIHDKIISVAQTLDIEDRIEHYPAELSIGQQQRVAMARALVKGPEIILADEPTGNLDEENRTIIVECLQAVAASGKVVIAATHDEQLLNNADVRFNILDKPSRNE